jgi:hypothetical protein
MSLLEGIIGNLRIAEDLTPEVLRDAEAIRFALPWVSNSGGVTELSGGSSNKHNQNCGEAINIAMVSLYVHFGHHD